MSCKRIFIKPIFIFIILFTSYFLLPTPYSPALAQEPDYDHVNEIAKNLNCPTCTGINLADCRTLTCEQWRNQINDLVAQGYSDEEVLNYFATRYGTQVLQEPPKSGWTLFLWVLPVLALLVGGGWLIFAMRGWANQKAVPVMAVSPQTRLASNVPHLPSHYLGQVEKDLDLGED
jgi:cytochrome c-type biogenesis protein CcmH